MLFYVCIINYFECIYYVIVLCILQGCNKTAFLIKNNLNYGIIGAYPLSNCLINKFLSFLLFCSVKRNIRKLDYL